MKRMTTAAYALRSRRNAKTTSKAQPGNPQRPHWAGQPRIHWCKLNCLLFGVDVSELMLKKKILNILYCHVNKSFSFYTCCTIASEAFMWDAEMGEG